MTYTLYGAPGSGSGIIEAALVELGVDHAVHDLDARNDEHRGDGFAALNPQRKMPALDLGDGELLTEALAILITLDERHGGLLPETGSAARARALRWHAFLAAELYPLVEVMDYPTRFAPDDVAPRVKARAHALWEARWQVLEGGLDGAPYALETGFSGLDLYLTVLSRWDLEPAWRRTHLPKIVSARDATHARPALAAVWKRHNPRMA